MSEIRLTVFFEEPFWVGIFERLEDGRLSACKVTFGAEPKHYEIQEFILRRYDALKFSAAIAAAQKQTADHPKRRQRNAKKQIQGCGVGTKSQQALAAQREQQKTERRQLGKAEKEAERLRRLAIRQQKRREKHKGH